MRRGHKKAHLVQTCEKCQKGIRGGHSAMATHVKHCGKGEERFWANVDKTTSPNGCWLYRGVISFEGYGHVDRHDAGKRRQYQAHRYAWLVSFKREIPKGKFLCHTCDVRHCVNPDHLYLGDHTANCRDMDARGRRRNGQNPVEELLWPKLSRRFAAERKEP